jgi:hypothetical protein
MIIRAMVAVFRDIHRGEKSDIVYLAIPKPNFSKMFLAAALVRYWVKVLAACGFLLALITAMG